ncbi:unnamed protein product, partial [Prorocentrum cordatum]
ARVVAQIRAGKSDGEIIAKPVVLTARLVLADSRAIAELSAAARVTWALVLIRGGGCSDATEIAGRRYQEMSQELAEKRKKGETQWGNEMKDFCLARVKQLSLRAVGEIALRWQWVRSESETALEMQGRLIAAIDSNREMGRKWIPLLRMAVADIKGERL